MKYRKPILIQKIMLVGSMSLFLGACGGGGGGDPVISTPATISTGVFTDAVVSGIAYATQTQFGITDANGRYDYIAGETVTFSIGDVVLGSVTAGPVITPLTLVGTTDVTDQHVTNIVRLLLTLDVDGNPDNGIEISDVTRTASIGLSIDFDVPILVFATDAVVAALVAVADTTNTILVDSGAAQTHLSNTIASTWGLMNWGTANWSAN